MNVKAMIVWTSTFLEANFNSYKMLPNLGQVTIATCTTINFVISVTLAIAETILILYNAGPLDVSWAVSSDKVVAILESFFPGQVANTNHHIIYLLLSV